MAAIILIQSEIKLLHLEHGVFVFVIGFLLVFLELLDFCSITSICLLPLHFAFLVNYCVLLTLAIVAIKFFVYSTPNTWYNSNYIVKNNWLGVNCIGCVFMVSPPKKKFIEETIRFICASGYDCCVFFLLYSVGTCSTLISNQLA